MCRISGIINPALSTSELKNSVQQMSDVLKHGGPDDQGLFVSEADHLVLGHRRLALIDLSACGHQPMSYENGRYQISYNGEVYNFIELKQELIQLGFQFTTNSDTEVILAAFAAWGTKSFTRFNGMFAFALWDSHIKKLYLVRGPSGIKPLYYSTINNSLHFASEVRAFKILPQFQQQDSKSLIYLLAYGHLPEPVTTISGVKVLPKGSFLTYDVEEGKYDIEYYAHYNFSEDLLNRKDAIELVRDELSKAVERHMISDAPIGVFLSGGIDSSIIALLASKFDKGMLNTLSLYFNEGEYSEKKYQDILLKSLSCNNTQYLLDQEQFTNSLPEVLRAMDLPSCDGINTWFISKYAKQKGLKAVLSGIGGDELFGGYPSFNRMKVVSMIDKIPDILLKAGKYTGNKKFKRLPYLALNGIKGKYLFLRGQFIPSEIARLLNTDEHEIWDVLNKQPLLPDINYLSTFNQASWMEVNLYMQNQLLRDSDVMSMAHGIELRVPFLDKRFMSAVYSIESNVKKAGSIPKQLLIDSFKDILPEAIWNRPKMGFSFPFKEWMINNSFVQEQMTGDQYQKMYLKFKNNHLHWSQLMTLLVSKQHFSA